jgi:hypothetical protein
MEKGCGNDAADAGDNASRNREGNEELGEVRCAICGDLLARLTENGMLEMHQHHHGERHILSWSPEDLEVIAAGLREIRKSP